MIEELPSYLAFLNKYVTAAQAVRITHLCHLSPFMLTTCSQSFEAVGSELDLGARLLPSSLFSTDSSRTQLSSLITETLSFASPYIVAGTPWLYKPLNGSACETSVTPVWRDAIWHLSVKWQFQYNDTLADRTAGYQTLSAHIQKFRDLTPDGGAYFVSINLVMLCVALTSLRGCRTKATCTSPTTRIPIGARTTISGCLRSSRSS